MAQASQVAPESSTYGLRREVLSPMETLAQSISTIAPTTTPVATIPLVCALAGNGTWLAYVLASLAILLVGACISKFARYTSSPGSLYTYTATPNQTSGFYKLSLRAGQRQQDYWQRAANSNVARR